jgi:peptidylprolyl isomerase domain and WD repeat-containing protein 1
MQVVNLHTNKVSRILGKVENNERFLRIALYQGDKGNKKVRKIPALAANVNDTKEPLSDPTLLCCAFKKHRIYTFRYASSSILGEYFIGWCPVPSSEFLFMHVISWKFDAHASSLLLYSRREPEEPEDATKGRDVFNEKPPPEELLSVSELGKTATTSLPDNLVSFLIIYIMFVTYYLNRL